MRWILAKRVSDPKDTVVWYTSLWWIFSNTNKELFIRKSTIEPKFHSSKIILLSAKAFVIMPNLIICLRHIHGYVYIPTYEDFPIFKYLTLRDISAKLFTFCRASSGLIRAAIWCKKFEIEGSRFLVTGRENGWIRFNLVSAMNQVKSNILS